MEEEGDRDLVRFDDWAYLPSEPERIDTSDSIFAEKFMRWDAEDMAREELNCTKTRAKKIVRGSLTRSGGVEARFNWNGTYIHREMFVKYLARVKESFEQAAEEREILRQQKEISKEVNSSRTRIVRSAVVRNLIRSASSRQTKRSAQR